MPNEKQGLIQTIRSINVTDRLETHHCRLRDHSMADGQPDRRTMYCQGAGNTNYLV